MKTKDWFSRFDLLGLRRRSAALLLVNLFLGVFAADAQFSLWSPSPASSDWSTGTNWGPPTPSGGPTGTATFGPSSVTSLTFASAPNSPLELAFEAGAPAYTFTTADFPLDIAVNGGLGILNSSSHAPVFNIEPEFGALTFSSSSFAENAIINNGALVQFFGHSNADRATINNNGAVDFFGSSSAGNATIITGPSTSTGIGSGEGIVDFVDSATGGNARFITNALGIFDMSDLTAAGMTAGSIEGAGTYNLGDKELTVGSNNLDTTVSGTINDGGLFAPNAKGGSLVKVGTGTLTLLGDNTYSGGTTIRDGTIAVGTLVAADQPISTALGTGNVFVDPGTLRTTSASTGVPLIINVGRNYTQAAGGTLALGIGGLQGEQYDHVQVGGNASLNGTLAVNSLNNFRPVAGNAFEVLRTNGSRSGEFAQVNDFLNNNPNLQRVDVYAPNGILLVYPATYPAHSANHSTRHFATTYY